MNTDERRFAHRSLQPAKIDLRNRLLRLVWQVTSTLLYRPTPAVLFAWRRLLLRAFGATIADGARPYPRVRIWAPWNLDMRADSCIANDVDCYCVAPIVIGRGATVSQYSYLCAASHDFRDPAMTLLVAPITVGDHAWLAADVFVGPGVRVGDGAVVGARSTVMRDVPAWTVVAGNPARTVGTRSVTSVAASN